MGCIQLQRHRQSHVQSHRHQGGKAVATTALARDTVVSIGSNGIELKGRAPVFYDDIQAIL